ncbi:glycosyltransferase family 2 protein [Candidatus Sumerlaeota bacterium]|nr:glycosyltransferase family 2 protein [Candidatus Sumerlaeota bacterium]
MQWNPSVSVVLCAYNRAKLLTRAVRSVLAQSVEDWELIIVDDGSTDETRETARPFVLADRRILYLLQAHRGLSAARNAGIAASRGEWITFLDSDDEYLPEHLERRLELVRAEPEAVFLHGGAEIVAAQESDFYVPDAEDPTRMIHLSKCAIGATFFARPQVFREAGGFDESLDYAMDFDLLKRILRHHPERRVELPTYRYHRGHGEGMCHQAAGE